MVYPRLAILSDLHIGSKVRSKDLCPDVASKLVNENYIDKFTKYINDQALGAEYIIIPGDVTDRASLEQFELASDIVLRLGAAFGLPEERILFVPGNHDKDWSIATTGNRRQDSELMYGNLKQPHLIFERVFNRSIHRCPDSRWAIWEYDDLLVVGYNSAWHDDANSHPHHGLVEHDALQEIQNVLRAVDLSPARLKLLIVHHHPIQYSNPIPETPDFSVMTNAQNLLKAMSEFRFDLIIHGHRHMPHFSPHWPNNNQPIAILGAGSFSYQLDHIYQGHAANLFHILEVDGRDDLTRAIFGKVNSWAYLAGHGWKPSELANGIPHQVGFGSYTNPNVLIAQLKPLVIAQKERLRYVRWSDLVATDEKLAYLNPECIQQIWDELALELNMQVWRYSNDYLLLENGQ